MNKLAAEHTAESQAPFTVTSRAFWVFFFFFFFTDVHLILPQTMVKASLAQQDLKFTSQMYFFSHTGPVVNPNVVCRTETILTNSSHASCAGPGLKRWAI